MRIGIELTALHAPEFAHRGIGRYARDLLGALARQNRRHEYVVYAWADEPAVGTALGQVRRLRMPEDLQGVVDRNPDGLDLLVMTAPFAGLHYRGFRLPSRGVGGCRVAAIIYDLIPYMFQDLYLRDLALCRAYAGRLGLLKHYDGLLAISGSTKRDVQRLLAVSRDRVFEIGSGIDLDFFQAAVGPNEVGAGLETLGISGPFVLTISGIDPRKNYAGLVTAFGLLPEELRRTHQLVVTCDMSEADEQAMRRMAGDHGVADRLVLTRRVADETLRMLYRNCAAFVSPSLYEGFGLPIAEGMACGAAVVAANNSAQAEVVGDAGLLFTTADAADLAAKLGRVLSDDAVREDLRKRGVERARKFTWEKVAGKMEDAFEMTNE
jgi:glycosyltransferase involved in cell wall biosynthesis